MKKSLIRILNRFPYIKGLRRDIDAYERWGLPGHFYNPIPSLDELENLQDKLFAIPQKDTDVYGIDLNFEAQVQLLIECLKYYKEIPFLEKKSEQLLYFFDNSNFSYNDAVMLYCMIRHFKPARIIEIGSGYSTCVTLDTNRLFFMGAIKCFFIEPYPELLIELTGAARPSDCSIIAQKIQTVDLELFRGLAENDILFIDSSHVLKAGSDLQHILFNIIPILKKGVIIHFHDIFFPFEYPKPWIVEHHRAWNEAYMLRSFLMYNNTFEILIFNDHITQRYPEWFAANMPICLKNTGGSLWLRKKE